MERAIAERAEAFTPSATITTARTRPSHPASTAVWPASSAALRAAVNLSSADQRRSSNSDARPTTRARPSTVPSTPSPCRLVNASTVGSGPTRSSAAAARARPIGCSEAFSSAPTRSSASSPSTSSAATTSTTDMVPVVTVPVLSSTTVSTRRVDSSTSGPLMSRPSCAPRPVPTSSAVGVARPSAQGHAMISTDTAAVNAAAAPAPATSHPARVASESAITAGTNTAATRSASRWTWALPCWASITRREIWASAVSLPTRVASTTSRPPALTVAPVTASPTTTSTGVLSPVSNEASTAEAPSSTMPSVAIFSPGRTTKRSPTPSASMLMRSSCPSRSTATSLAPSSSRARSAAPVRRLARASK